jgi:putative two-component system response regulator
MARSTGKFPAVRSATGKHKAITGSHKIVRRTVLVVDDAPEIARLVAKILGKSYRVVIASDGEEALTQVAADPPDLILLDLHMPKLDGWEVCRRLKGDAKTRDIAIVIMTAGDSTPEDAERALRLGADEYLMKPFVREVLLHNVERLLR